MASTGRGSRDQPTPESQPPTQFASVPPPQQPPMVDYSFTLQAVMELHKLVAEIGAKTDRLIADVASHSIKLDTVSHQISFVKGAMWVIGGLVALAITLGTIYYRTAPSTLPAPQAQMQSHKPN